MYKENKLYKTRAGKVEYSFKNFEKDKVRLKEENKIKENDKVVAWNRGTTKRKCFIL